MSDKQTEILKSALAEAFKQAIKEALAEAFKEALKSGEIEAFLIKVVNSIGENM